MPLAYFLLSQQAELPEQELSSAREQASVLVQQALLMFPGGGCAPGPRKAAPHPQWAPDAPLTLETSSDSALGVRALVSPDADRSIFWGEEHGLGLRKRGR